MPSVMLSLPLLLVACSLGPETPFDGPRRPPTERFQDPGLAQSGAGPVVRLWKEEGRYELPDATLVPGYDPEMLLPVAFGSSPAKQRKGGDIYTAPDPFQDHVNFRRGPPPGLELVVDRRSVPYDRGLRKRPSWRRHDDGLELLWPEGQPLNVDAIGLRYPSARDTLFRRDPVRSELEPRAFVDYEVTQNERTRPGLLLPAPGRASWSIPLPAGRSATLDTHVTIAPTPLVALGSDGAWAVVRVRAGDEATELARVWIDGDTDAFTPVRADLSRWAGQEVEVELASEPHGTNHFDHVVFGAPTVWSGAEGEPARVVVIGMDTTRPQAFGWYGYGRDTTPELDAVANSGTVFPRAWTPAPRTRPSFRSATTGRRPLDAVGATTIGQVFSDHGFATAGYVANLHLVPRFDFNDGFDDWWLEGSANAEQQVDKALAFLDANRERDTYVFLHIMDPHMNYGAPGSYHDMFVTDPDPSLAEWFARSDVYEWMEKGTLTEQRKEHIRARYDGELRYSSVHLGRLFDQLDRLEGRTLVVLHNDHGEEFWEHGTFEHNHTLYDDVTRGLLWFRTSGGQAQGATIDAPVSLPDIAPTLFDFAGFDPATLPPTDGRSLKGLLEGTEDAASWAERPIGIAHLRYGLDRWGVVYRNHKYILHTAAGTEELYDLGADPGEQHDLARSTDLEPWRQQLGPAHGIDVGFGWRIRIGQVAKGETLTMELPEPALWAEVVPPSMTIPDPANQAWGEPPRRDIAEIGSVTLSDDKKTLTYAAGTRPKDGLIFVRFASDASPDQARLLAGDEELLLLRATVWSHASPERTIRIEPGTVLQPPPSEADRMRAASGEASADEILQLCQLGYITGEACEGVEAVGDAHEGH